MGEMTAGVLETELGDIDYEVTMQYLFGTCVVSLVSYQ